MGNVFMKIKQIKDLVNEIYPKLSIEELTQEIQFLSNYWHGSKRKGGIKLTPQQLVIYELLVKNNYNPATAYRWLLLATAPKDLQEKVKYGELSIRDALKERKKEMSCISVTEREFMQAIIRCFELYLSEPGENYPGRTMK